MKNKTSGWRWFFLLCFFGQGQALAESVVSRAEARLHNVITLTENQDIRFNTIPGGSGLCSMAESGELGGHCAGLPNGIGGQFTITGTPGEMVEMFVSNGSTANGVTIFPKFNNEGATQSSALLNEAGEAVIGVVADLLLSNTNSGIRHLTYILSVNYP